MKSVFTSVRTVETDSRYADRGTQIEEAKMSITWQHCAQIVCDQNPAGICRWPATYLGQSSLLFPKGCSDESVRSAFPCAGTMSTVCSGLLNTRRDPPAVTNFFRSCPEWAQQCQRSVMIDQWTAFGSLEPTLPKMQLSHWVTSQGSAYQKTCSWSHRRLHTALFRRPVNTH